MKLFLLPFLLIINQILSQTETNKRFEKQSRNIFFDLGAFDGHSTETFLSSGKDKGDNLARDGSGLNKDIFFHPNKTSSSLFEVVMVEANINHNEKLFTLKNSLISQNLVTSITIYNGTGLSTVNGYADFILDKVLGGSAGSTLKRFDRTLPLLINKRIFLTKRSNFSSAKANPRVARPSASRL
jgi:hypothetical protein